MRRLFSATLVALLVAGLLPLPVLAAAPVAVDDPDLVCDPLSATGGSMPIPEDWGGGSTGFEGWFALVGTCAPMANDYDLDGDSLTLEIVDSPAHGDIASQPDGFLAYDPDPDFSTPPGDAPGGTWVSDVITYRLFDGTDRSNTASYRIWAAPVNDAPSFTPGPNVTVNEDSGAYSNAWASDISAGPENEVDQTVSFEVDDVSAPSVFETGPAISDTGVLTFEPAADASGLSTVTVHAVDDGGLEDYNVPGVVPVDSSASTTFSIVIDGENDPPVAADQSPTVIEDTATPITVAGTDADGDPLTYLVLTDPTHGSLTGTAPDLTYTPAANYTGPDSFTFRVTDGTADALVDGTVSIDVTPANDPPVATAQAVTTAEDTAKAIALAGSDVEGSTLTYTLTGTGPAHGTLTGTVPNLTYAPSLNYTGSDSFTFKVNDGSLDSLAEATVAITVTAVNDAPVARTDGFTVNATSTGTLAVLTNDLSGPPIDSVTSEPADTITVTSVTQGAKVSVSIAPGGTGILYDVKGCSSGGDSFSYTVTDGQGAIDTATAFVTIARPGTNGLSSNPITDTPNLRFITNSTIGSTVPARLSWCGVTRSGYSVRAYRVGQSTNGGSSYASTPIVRGTTATSSTRNLAVGTTYRWRARTTDSAGRVGSYRYSLTSRIGRYQESSAAITYTGPWARSTTTSASGGAVRRTSTAGATATITLTNARQFAIVGPRSSTRGSFEVWVDGKRVATVSERASTTVNRRVLFVGSLAGGVGISHTIQVRAVGNGRIDLDAILTLF